MLSKKTLISLSIEANDDRAYIRYFAFFCAITLIV